MNKPIIVISAINLFEGGTLSILNDCLDYLSNLTSIYKIIAFVHKKELIKQQNIEIIEVANSRKSYFYRFYYEYYWFKKQSKKIQPYLWLSLHDMTPNVIAQKRVVYCHNSSPFYKSSFKDAVLEPSIYLFSKFYKYIYKINIKKNNYVIVQQHWLKQEFEKMFGINNIIVARPNVNISVLKKDVKKTELSSKTIFFYPSLPRVFKNFELLGDATKILISRGIVDFRVIITVDGTENRYAKWLLKNYQEFPQMEFRGKLTREEVYEMYQKTDCVIFPSKLESWGLPITEAKCFDKPLLLADLPYAHEALGDYDKAVFFDPNSAVSLALFMEKYIKGELDFYPIKGVLEDKITTHSWGQLFDILLKQ